MNQKPTVKAKPFAPESYLCAEPLCENVLTSHSGSGRQPTWCYQHNHTSSRVGYDRSRRNPRRYQIMYGLTPEAVEELDLEHCEVCGSSPKEEGYQGRAATLVVDHDHETGAFRGVLCRSCNLALGMIKDNPETLRKLAVYLERCT